MNTEDKLVSSNILTGREIMDLQSACVCVFVFIISASILLLISLFGIREKSYEEVLAAKRQLTSASQMGKEKKLKTKKASKKVKEKEKQKATSASATAPVVREVSALPAQRAHVEFVEPVTHVEPAKKAPPPTEKKKSGKKDKERTKSILLNKDDPRFVQMESLAALTALAEVSANHFAQLHPKDEFELLHSYKDVEKQEFDGKSKLTKQKISSRNDYTIEQQQQQQQQQLPPTSQQIKRAAVAIQKEKDVKQLVEPEVMPLLTVQQHTIANNSANSVKEKKKKKSEFNTLQQLAANDKYDVNVSLLVPLIRKADLSRSEIQILIDMLLNKQHEAPAIVDQWTEGRSDPVQKLRKQLAEKERALSEEQEALHSAQARLREMRAEWNAERSRLLQNCRTLDETVHAKHSELQTVGARAHAQSQKLQAQLNDEVMAACKLRDDLSTAQMQCQQLDMHLTQKQEAESSFQNQLAQLRADLQEQQNINAKLSVELHAVHEKAHAEKELLHERIRQMESHYKQEADQGQELARQLEESRLMFNELEHRFGVTHRNETELKMRCQQHLDDMRRLETKSHEDVNQLQAEIARLNLLHKQQQDEHKRHLSELQSQLVTIQKEKSNLEAANDDAALVDKNRDVKILNLQNELASARGELQQRQTQIAQLTAELRAAQQSVEQLKIQLETVSAAQQSFKTQFEMLRIQNDEMVRNEERKKMKHFFQRLFPDLKSLDNETNWSEETEQKIRDCVEHLQQNQNTKPKHQTDLVKLQAQLAHYRQVIDDTEGMLNKLQLHVEHEEINWRREIELRDKEIVELKKQTQNHLPLAKRPIESYCSQQDDRDDNDDVALLATHKTTSNGTIQLSTANN